MDVLCSLTSIYMSVYVLSNLMIDIEGMCNTFLISGNNRINDNKLTASSTSEFGVNGVAQSRINTQADYSDGNLRTRVAGCWLSKDNNPHDYHYIQVELNAISVITGIVTQGRASSPNETGAKYEQWVTQYKVRHRNDGINFYPTLNENGVEIFLGNTDRDSIVYNKFQKPIVAQFIKLKPVAWHTHIALRWDLIGCEDVETDCNGFLISGPNRINDSQLTASSVMFINATGHSRLNTPGGDGGWVPNVQDIFQYIQAELNDVSVITGIATQGRASHQLETSSVFQQWVTQYKVIHGDDGTIFIPTLNENDTELFIGNTDRDTISTNMFSTPIVAQFIRVNPIAWKGPHICMRWDAVGCTDIETNFSQYLISGPSTNSTLTASSVFGARVGPDRSRLNSPRTSDYAGAWVPANQDQNQFIQVELNDTSVITGIVTQGRASSQHETAALFLQWVTQYKVLHSYDGIDFIPTLNDNGSEEFTGNTDRDTIVINMFQRPTVAKLVRVNPIAWNANTNIALRWDLLGSQLQGIQAVTQMTSSATSMSTLSSISHAYLISGPDRIDDSKITASSSWPGGGSAPERSRINMQAKYTEPSLPLAGAWVADTQDIYQYIQVELNVISVTTGIVTQGRASSQHETTAEYQQWVTQYKVLHSYDGTNFYPTLNENGVEAFTGNVDRNTIVYNKFERPILAQFIRVNPIGWNTYIAMRWDLVGYSEINCNQYIIGGPTTNTKLTASSEWQGGANGPERSRLNTPYVEFPNSSYYIGGWVAGNQDQNDYIQVELSAISVITGIATQGRASGVGDMSPSAQQWVTQLKVLHSYDGTVFNQTFNKMGTEIFTGNTDRDSTVTNMFQRSVAAQFVRVNPIAWNNYITLRWDLIGCNAIDVASQLSTTQISTVTTMTSTDQPSSTSPQTNVCRIDTYGNGQWRRSVNMYKNGIASPIITSSAPSVMECNNFILTSDCYQCLHLTYDKASLQCNGYASMPSMTFIKQEDSFFLFSKTPTGRPFRLGCRDGYSYFPDVKGTNGWCVKLYRTPMLNFTDAQATCNSEGAQLIVVDTQEKQTIVMNKISTAYQGVQNTNAVEIWIGAVRFGDVGTDWVWTSGKSLSVDENSGSAGNCGHIWLTDLTQFSDHVCGDETAFLCDHILF